MFQSKNTKSPRSVHYTQKFRCVQMCHAISGIKYATSCVIIERAIYYGIVIDGRSFRQNLWKVWRLRKVFVKPDWVCNVWCNFKPGKRVGLPWFLEEWEIMLVFLLILRHRTIIVYVTERSSKMTWKRSQKWLTSFCQKAQNLVYFV